MEIRHNLRGGSRTTGIVSAILLCLAALLAAAHGPLTSGGMSRLAISVPATGGMGVANQPSTPVVHNRAIVVISSKPDKPTILNDAGSGHVALPPDGTGFPEFALRQPALSLANPSPACGIDRGYDACAPPALI